MVVFADYDVDGASSAAQLVRWFRAMGRELPIYVPDRHDRGLWPEPRRLPPSARRRAPSWWSPSTAARRPTTPSAAAGEIGLEVVVIDHHLMRDDAAGRRRRGQSQPAGLRLRPGRAGGGRRDLRAAGGAEPRGAAARPVRRPARAGPAPMARPGRPGRHLRRDPAGRLQPRPGRPGAEGDVGLGQSGAEGADGRRRRQAGPASVFHAGFILGPRINAGGRIGRSDLGARLLSTDDPAEAPTLAERARRAERRAQGGRARRSPTRPSRAIEPARNFDPAAPAIVVAGEGWHPGRDRHRRQPPARALPQARGGHRPRSAPPDVGKGSGRSQPGVNLGRAVQAAFDEGLLLAGGGHAMAAGLTLRRRRVPEFRAFLCERLADESASAAAEPTRWRSTPWSPPAPPTAPCSRTSSAWRRSAPAIPSRCSPLADVRVEQAMPHARRPRALQPGDADGRAS